MFDDPFLILVAGAVLLVLVILARGIMSFGRGGEAAGKRSNKLMRYRIYAQAFAVVLIVAFVLLRKGG